MGIIRRYFEYFHVFELTLYLPHDLHNYPLEASALLVLSLALVTGMLIHQEYLVVPSEFPLLSLWFVFNIGSALDATFVISRMSWKTNFFGVKPGTQNYSVRCISYYIYEWILTNSQSSQISFIHLNFPKLIFI